MTSQSVSDGVPDAQLSRGVRLRSGIILGSVLGITILWLRYEGRRWWCQSGDWSPWSSGIHSSHTSQHLFDPYSFSHFLHGLLFYALLRYAAGRLRWDARLVLAVGLECLWELFENSGMVIDRYRRSTIALGYEGDSIINSLGDIVSCAVGFLVATRLPIRWSLALYLLIELTLLILYRDNLTLNVIMLGHPFEALKSWQMGR